MRGNTCLVSLKENIHHEKKYSSTLGITIAHEPARTYITTLCGQKREGVSYSKKKKKVCMYIAQTVLALYNMAFSQQLEI